MEDGFVEVGDDFGELVHFLLMLLLLVLHERMGIGVRWLK